MTSMLTLSDCATALTGIQERRSILTAFAGGHTVYWAGTDQSILPMRPIVPIFRSVTECHQTLPFNTENGTTADLRGYSELHKILPDDSWD